MVSRYFCCSLFGPVRAKAAGGNRMMGEFDQVAATMEEKLDQLL